MCVCVRAYAVLCYAVCCWFAVVIVVLLLLKLQRRPSVCVYAYMYMFVLLRIHKRMGFWFYSTVMGRKHSSCFLLHHVSHVCLYAVFVCVCIICRYNNACMLYM